MIHDKLWTHHVNGPSSDVVWTFLQAKLSPAAATLNLGIDKPWTLFGLPRQLKKARTNSRSSLDFVSCSPRPLADGLPIRQNLNKVWIPFKSGRLNKLFTNSGQSLDSINSGPLPAHGPPTARWWTTHCPPVAYLWPASHGPIKAQTWHTLVQDMSKDCPCPALVLGGQQVTVGLAEKSKQCQRFVHLQSLSRLC